MTERPQYLFLFYEMITLKNWQKIILGLSTLAVGGLTYLSLRQPQWMFRLASQLQPDALFFVDTEEPIIALTIDDGPHVETTEAILDVLKRHQVQATFFMLSDELSSHAEVMQRLVAEGHELGNHMTADESSLRLSPEEFETKLLRADQALTAYETNITWFRPGMGLYNNRMVNVIETEDYELVLGSLFPYDTHLPSLRFAQWFVLGNLDPGDILVLHDGPKGHGERTVRLLEKLIPKIQARGYRIVTLTELHRQ